MHNEGRWIPLALSEGVGEYYGPEIITNGSFADATGWTLGTDWAISGGSLNHANSAVFEYATFGLSTDYVPGATYRVEFDYTHTSGDAAVWVRGAASATTIPTGSGHKIMDIVAASGTTGFRFASQTLVGSIDNLSVRRRFGGPP